MFSIDHCFDLEEDKVEECIVGGLLLQGYCDFLGPLFLLFD